MQSSCCHSSLYTVRDLLRSKAAQPSGAMENTYEVVRDYYGKVLANSKDLKTNACVCCERPPDHILDAIKQVPSEVRTCPHEQTYS